MDNHYNGISYISDNLKNCEEMNIKSWSHSKFIQMCILAGCDYLSSPKGIGLKTAYFQLNKFTNAKMLIENFDKELEENYEELFMCSYLAFRYSIVYCPLKKGLSYLNTFDPNNLRLEDSFDYLAMSIARRFMPNLEFLGEIFDN